MIRKVVFAFSLIFFQLVSPTLVMAQIPHVSTIIGGNPVASHVGGANQDLGTLISNVLSLVFALAGIIAFVWAFIGAFQYIIAGGKKEALGKAKGRITWAIIGLVFLIISFALSRYIRDILQIQDATITPISHYTIGP